ncbi:MAG: hypothetical protein FK733_16905 [Asgard group archaeon]|nr:hypothetical protein [Asgard group archaeon]
MRIIRINKNRNFIIHVFLLFIVFCLLTNSGVLNLTAKISNPENDFYSINQFKDYTIESVGNFDDNGIPNDVFIDGDYAFVAFYGLGLRIIDISNPLDPTVVSVFKENIRAIECIYIANDIAYILDRLSGLVIVDVSNPLVPVSLGQFDYGVDIPTDVAIYGNYALVTDTGDGGMLRVINIEDPAEPYEVQFFEDVNPINLFVVDDYVYVANYSGGLAIFEMRNVFQPVPIGSYDTDQCLSVYVSDEIAYVTDDNDGLILINLTDHENPTYIAEYSTSSDPLDVAVSNNMTYIATTNGGLEIINVSIPTSPALEGTFDDGGYITKLAITNDHVFLCDEEDGIEIIDVSTPDTPTEVAEFIDGGYYDLDNVHSYYTYDVDADDNYAYIADGMDGLEIIDLTDPTTPVEISQYSADFTATDVFISGNYAYLCTIEDGLLIVDISVPASPSLVSQTNDSIHLAEKVIVNGDYAFVFSVDTSVTDSNITIFDISSPSTPLTLEVIDTDYTENIDFAINGNYLYIVKVVQLEIYDISDPSNPTQETTLNLSTFQDEANSFYISGTYAYIGASDGLHIYDLSNPLNPVHTGNVEHLAYDANDVFVFDDFAYILRQDDTYDWGLTAIYISDPTDPTIASEDNYMIEDMDSEDIFVTSDYIFVAYGEAGVEIVELVPESTGKFGINNPQIFIVISFNAIFILLLIGKRKSRKK